MRIIISIIVIIILIIFLLLLVNSNNIKETFITQKDLDDIKNYQGKVTDTYDTIDEPISDSLIPSNPKNSIKINDYDVIEIFKYILERPPTIQELKKYAYYTKEELKEFLYNSPEYDKLIKTQNNDVNNGIEGAIAKKNLINRIITIYSTVYKEDLPIKMMTPLRDCFIHLQLNEFLFASMLESYNYKKFEVDVLSTNVLTKKVLLQLFNKHFNVLELKLISQQKINDANNQSLILKKEVEKIKNDLLAVGSTDNSIVKSIINTVKSTYPTVYNELVKTTIKNGGTEQSIGETTDIDTLNSYLTKIEKYTNVNVNVNDKTIEHLALNTKTKDDIKKLDDNAELYVRVYNPIVHNTSYNLPAGYKPPICTSIGQDQLVQPIFTESKLLFQGTDLNSAFNNTQVGSIMPKFIYKEYTDVKIN